MSVQERKRIYSEYKKKKLIYFARERFTLKIDFLPETRRHKSIRLQ